MGTKIDNEYHGVIATLKRIKSEDPLFRRLYANIEIDGRRRVIDFYTVEEMKKFGEILIGLAENIKKK